MKYKKAVIRSAVIICILTLSVLTGLLYQVLFTVYEKKTYPQNYSEYVEKYSSQYGVPEYVIYSVIKVESGYRSEVVSDKGAIGLMQIMPYTFNWLLTLTKENYDTGMLYDPATNIKYGTYLISYLYLQYGSWDNVFAAYNAGMGNVDKWLEDEKNSDDKGKLIKIPFEETDKYVKKVNKSIEIYRRLYYEA